MRRSDEHCTAVGVEVDVVGHVARKNDNCVTAGLRIALRQIAP
jgi:primosomal replication protein N